MENLEQCGRERAECGPDGAAGQGQLPNHVSLDLMAMTFTVLSAC